MSSHWAHCHRGHFRTASKQVFEFHSFFFSPGRGTARRRPAAPALSPLSPSESATRRESRARRRESGRDRRRVGGKGKRFYRVNTVLPGFKPL